jgi:hypothetical protein
MNKIKTGLAVGYFLGLLHLIWAISVAIMPNQIQSFFNWVFDLHGLQPFWIITSMTLAKAITLVIFTFIVGYIIGWVYAFFHHVHDKKK